MQDRLAELRKKRGLRDQQEDTAISINGDHKSDETFNLDESMQPYHELKNSINRIKANTGKLKELKQRSNQECTKEAQTEIFNELDDVMDDTKTIAKGAQGIMKSCRESNQAYAEENPRSASAAFRKNMLNTHSRHFQEVITEFQTGSEAFKKALKEKITRQARIVKKDITDDQIEELIQSKDVGHFMEKEMMMSRGLVDRVAEIEERHEGILKIEQGVREIQEMFNDLAYLVELQQEKLDNIEHNIQQTKGYTEKAVKNIKVAEEHGKAARRKQCYIMLCCLVLLAIILIPTLTSVMGSA